METSSKTQTTEISVKGENLIHAFTFKMGFAVQSLPFRENLHVKAGPPHSAGKPCPS